MTLIFSHKATEAWEALTKGLTSTLLSDHEWKIKYTVEDGDLLNRFYIPALECAVRYDRITGYFTSGGPGCCSQGC